MELKFRELTAADVECRVSTVSDKGCSLLLYKDARCDMRLLDEAVGPMNWMRSHEVINGNLFCNVSIWDGEKREWITKQDVGVESYTEKEKGQASDAFKRACFNFGIGRELYTAPFIWIGAENVNLKPGKDGKQTTYDKFSVLSMEVKDGVITELTIRNNTKKCVCYTYGAKGKNTEDLESAITEEQVSHIMAEVERTGIEPAVILDMFHVNTYNEMTQVQFTACMNKFRKTPDKVV